MKLKVNDQIHVSSVSQHTLGKGQEITVSKAVGAELLKRHPAVFEALDDADEEPAEKAAETHEDKAAPVSANKAAPKAEAKSKA